jgi:hypothetical protein
MADDSIGILGSGDVGNALATGFARHGWAVTLGTRRTEALREWLDGTDGDISVGSFPDAASFGDVVVLAVRGDAVEDVLGLAGRHRFAGSLVLDATNPLDFSGEGPPHLLFGGTDSLGERVQSWLPDARVVKCFNTVSNAQMLDPEFESETPPMLICGDDAGAKDRTGAILVELGWPGAFDVGTIESSRYLEAMVPLRVRVGATLDTWRHAVAFVE